MKSIRRSMALAMGGAAIVLLVAGGGGIYLTLRQTLTAQFDEALITKAQALVSASEVDDGKFEIDFDIQAFAGFGTRAPGDYFQVFTAEGRTLARSPSLWGEHLSFDGVPADRKRIFPVANLPDGRPGRAVITTFSPRDDDERQFQNLRLIVASDVARLRATLRTIAIVLGVFGGLGIVLVVFILHTILGAGLRPLSRLARDVQGIDLATSRRRISEEGLPEELAPVARKLNELLGRLEETFARERRFSSNAAHELRTPLAELKVMTELGVRWPEEFSATHGREILAVIAELETLLDRLSLLARADAGVPGERETVDLDGAIRDCVRAVEADIARRGLTLRLQAHAGDVLTDRALWKAIANNLVTNAVHHAPAGTSIGVDLSEEALRVTNEAPDLSPTDLDRIFERFWRKSGDGKTAGHSGLGLSIARACAESIGGSCTARLDGGRITVEATWNRTKPK